MYLPFGQWSYPLYLISLAVQIFLAVHAARTGRYWWIFIILFFGPIGAAIYFFVEYMPAARSGNAMRSVKKVGAEVARRINPEAEVRRLQDVVALTPTVNNRMELARAYLRAGKSDDAVATYEGAAQGIYADDPRLLYELAGAYHQQGNLPRARETYERLRRQGGTLTPEQLLLGARILEEAGDTDGALREYQALAGRGAGEEGRVRYGLLLKQLGRADEAHAVFDQIVRHARVSSGRYRKEEKHWIEIAQREIKERAGTA